MSRTCACGCGADMSAFGPAKRFSSRRCFRRARTARIQKNPVAREREAARRRLSQNRRRAKKPPSSDATKWSVRCDTGDPRFSFAQDLYLAERDAGQGRALLRELLREKWSGEWVDGPRFRPCRLTDEQVRGLVVIHGSAAAIALALDMCPREVQRRVSAVLKESAA